MVYRRYLKRFFDIFLSAAGLVFLLPVWVLLVAAIKLDSKGPMLFKQKRVGKDKRTFTILKFRTMRIDTPCDIPTHQLANPHQCITRVGRILRKASLDELPQLWNILVGDMSIVGPRPALWNQDDLVAERDKYGANAVRPGLTGWAQINGRDELEIPVKAKLDGEYVRNIGLRMDFVCFIGSIGTVLKRDGMLEGGTGMLKNQMQSVKDKVDDRK